MSKPDAPTIASHRRARARWAAGLRDSLNGVAVAAMSAASGCHPDDLPKGYQLTPGGQAWQGSWQGSGPVIIKGCPPAVS